MDAKGPTPYAVKFFANFLKHLGYRRAVMMSDGEHSIVALKEQAAREAQIFLNSCYSVLSGLSRLLRLERIGLLRSACQLRVASCR